VTPAELAALHARAFTVPRPFSEAEFAALLGTASVFLCAEPGGLLLGRVIADEAELLTLAVAPVQRRRGLGAQLVAAFHTTAMQRGARVAFLDVDERNTAARALYQSAGYVEAGRRRRYYKHPDGASDALVLTRELRGSA
jgi:ribosomal-protein-alanine N-acetyltransferase